MLPNIDRVPDRIQIHYQGGEHQAAPQGGAVAVNDITVRTVPENGDVPRLVVQIQAGATPVRLVKLRWQLPVPAGQFLGDAWERTYGDTGWTGLQPTRAMPWYFLLQVGDEVAGYGVQVRAGAMCYWQADPAGITLCLDVRSGGAGVVLGKRTLAAATVVQRHYQDDDAFAAACAFCALLCPDPLLPPAPVYGSNNWYYAYGQSSAAEILGDARYLARLTDGLANRPYMVIDDCWQPAHSADYNGGPWDGGNADFPDMAQLAHQITALDLKPGIWFRPLRDDVSDLPADWRLPGGALDPSHPGVLAHVAADVQRICRWGYRLIKHDFSTFDLFGRWGFAMQPFVTPDGPPLYDNSKTNAEVLVQFYRTILEAARPYGTLILGCNTVGHLAAGLEHMQRTGDDTSGYLWEVTLRMGVNTLAMRMPQHRTFFDCDADCLGITGAILWERNKLWGDLLARSGTSLFVSAKPGVLTPQQEAELAAMLAIGSRQEVVAQPLDWQHTPYPQDWRVGHKTLHYDWYEEFGMQAATGSGGSTSMLLEGRCP